MKKIIFLAVNIRFTHSNLALLYLAKIAESYRFCTHILEYNLKTDKFEILRDLLREKPDILAISVYIWNSAFIENLLEGIEHVLPSTRIIMGGPEVSWQSEMWFVKYPFIDHIVVGAGEASFHKLLETDFCSSNNLVLSSSYHLNKIPFPYDKNNIKSLKNKYIYYESSRGCPNRCIFCLSSRKDAILEFRETGKVLKELEFFLENKVKIVKFVDRTFNSKPEHSQKIWKFLLSQNLSTIFHFEINPYLLNDSDFVIFDMFPEDCFQFEVGVQSLNPETLGTVCRSIDTSKLLQNLQNLLKIRNIHTHLDLIIGLPYESYDTFKDSFNHLCQLDPDYLQLGFLKVLPGTVMWEKTTEFGLKYEKCPPYHILSTLWLKAEEVIFLKHLSYIFNNIYNSGKFRYTVKAFSSIFEGHFSFFENLTIFWLNNMINFGLKDWSKISGLLLEFAAESDPRKVELIRDSLCYDWFLYACTNHLPDHLSKNNQRKPDLEYAEIIIKEFTQGGKIKPETALKHSLIFEPQSREFFSLFKPDFKAIILFRQRQKRKLLFMGRS